ncbi:hypothetical protein LCGC14_0406350 [marine sediment metagenome]|uniref:Uncharacterized protein n=1 Tax=marine sediment metagenome TaxID=412755 RepID=A0A0F9VHE5_9ZZZZ
MTEDKRPTEEEMKLKIMQYLWGGVDYKEFIQWLKDRGLIRSEEL